jgi:hypothetical protein
MNAKNLFLCLVLSSYCLPPLLAAQTNGIKFKPKLLAIDANEGIDVADIDGDGKLDVVEGRNWYQAPDFAPRPLRLVEDWNGYVQSNGDFCHDVDGDGLIDVIAGSFLPTEVHWYKNPGGDGLKLGQVWKKAVLVDTKLSQNESSFLHDFDGDGQPEWITNSWKNENPVVVWKFTTRGKSSTNKNAKSKAETASHPSLTKHVVGKNGNGHGMGFGDINNDGREDILFANGWYERPESDALSKAWKFHADWNGLHASCPMLIKDLNGDGLNDLVWGKGHDYGLYWWEAIPNDDTAAKLEFKQHVIDDRFSQPHTIHFADLDGDGNEELISGKRVRGHNGKDPGGTEVPCMYYYKWNRETNSFKRFVIDEGHIGTGLQIRTADLNSDGKLDIAVAGKDGTWLLLNQSGK